MSDILAMVNVEQQSLSLLSTLLGVHATMVAAALAGFGALLWLCGARFSRSIITLAGVGVGAFLGIRVPALMHWPMDGIAMAFAGAMVLGLIGWALQTTVIGFFLTTLLSILFAAIAWASLAGDAAWSPPVLSWSMSQTSMLNTLWKSLPGVLPQVMPYAVGAGASTGAALTLLWPKIARVITYGLLGTILIAVMGSVLAQRLDLHAITDALPQTFAGQLCLFIAVAMIGMLVQWLMLPSVKRLPQKATAASAPPIAGQSPRQSLFAHPVTRKIPAPAVVGGSVA